MGLRQRRRSDSRMVAVTRGELESESGRKPGEDRLKRLFACIWDPGNCQMRRPPPDDSIFN